MTTPSQIEQQTPVTSIDAPFPWFGGKSSSARTRRNLRP
jgi:hypothetical protein